MRFLYALLPMIGLSLLCDTGLGQNKNAISLTTGKYGDGPDSIAPVGIIKNISDSSLLDIIQRQTFRYFWHYGHPVSGLARERDNTVYGQYYWDWIDEAYGTLNISNNAYGPEACAMAGTGMGIMATIVAVERKWIGRDTAVRRLVKMVNFLLL